MALQNQTFRDLKEGRFFIFCDDQKNICIKTSSYGFYHIATPCDGEWELTDTERDQVVLEVAVTYAIKNKGLR